MDELRLYKINQDYIRFLHRADYKVSHKFSTRPFVGFITMDNGVKYFLPLTSKTTQMRLDEGKTRRAWDFTTFVRDSSGKEISNILHNNMIPAIEGTYAMMDISAETDILESNEIRYLRKNKEKIIRKAKKIYKARTEGENPFYNKMCCDYKLLEKVSLKYKTVKKYRQR